MTQTLPRRKYGFNHQVYRPSSYYKQYGRKRLLKLAKYLLTVPRSQFDMRTWFDRQPEEHGCQTVGCAMGHAACIPEFRRSGLKFSNNKAYKSDSCGTFGIRFREESGDRAGALFFGLDFDEAHHLFMPEYYVENPTPKQVSRVIRDFVKQKDKSQQVKECWNEI